MATAGSAGSVNGSAGTRASSALSVTGLAAVSFCVPMLAADSDSTEGLPMAASYSANAQAH